MTNASFESDGHRGAEQNLTFDQLHQDQVIGVRSRETDGKRRVALEIWDRPDAHVGDLITKLNAANGIVDAAQREAAAAAVLAAAPAGHTRVFVGKEFDRSASVVLSDADGHPRLRSIVDANGNPRIEFLDDKGQVTQRLPQGK